MSEKSNEHIDFSEVLERFRGILARKAETKKKIFDKDIANALGVSAAQVAVYKKRNKIPYQMVIDYCIKEEIDIEYITYGRRSLSSLSDDKKVKSDKVPLFGATTPLNLSRHYRRLGDQALMLCQKKDGHELLLRGLSRIGFVMSAYRMKKATEFLNKRMIPYVLYFYPDDFGGYNKQGKGEVMIEVHIKELQKDFVINKIKFDSNRVLVEVNGDMYRINNGYRYLSKEENGIDKEQYYSEGLTMIDRSSVGLFNYFLGIDLGVQ